MAACGRLRARAGEVDQALQLLPGSKLQDAQGFLQGAHALQVLFQPPAQSHITGSREPVRSRKKDRPPGWASRYTRPSPRQDSVLYPPPWHGRSSQ